jgi:hypothetical protein
MSFDNRTKQIHSIDSDGCGAQKIGRKILGLHNQKTKIEPSTPEKSITTQEAAIQAGDEAKGEAKIDHYTTCITKEIQPHDKRLPNIS